MSNKLLSLSEFSRVIGCSQRTLAQAIASGQIPVVTIGKRRRVDARVLEMWNPLRAEQDGSEARQRG